MQIPALALAMALGAAGVAHAHGDQAHAVRPFDPRLAEQKPFGISADPAKAARTVQITMSDRMSFSPSTLTIRVGETVRFVVRNDGKALHEIVLGTREELAKHAEEMRKTPDMEHDEPHMLHVKPGASGAMGWAFNRAGEFEFACLIPGHYEAGMKGRIIVK
jgi:uncharacterized cupredoxin-like copper-binding protein